MGVDVGCFPLLAQVETTAIPSYLVFAGTVALWPGSLYLPFVGAPVIVTKAWFRLSDILLNRLFLSLLL